MATQSFSIAEARHDLAAVVHQLEHQPHIQLTRRGKPVAVLMSLRPAPNPKVMAWLRRHSGELAIVSLVWHELWFGCQRLPTSTKRTAIEQNLNEVVAVSMVILPNGQAAAEWHAAERARLMAWGRHRPLSLGRSWRLRRPVA